MIFNKTTLKDAYIIELNKFKDERGFFARSFCAKEFEDHGIKFPVAQVNVSYNRLKQTLRGLHYQQEPHGEAKLMQCTKGSIYDVIIDMRSDSPTYMQWIGVELTQNNHRLLYVPERFAHGYLTLEDDTEVIYQVSEFYTAGAEQGIRWDDPAFNIDWPLEPKIISEKDKSWLDYKEVIRI